MCSLAAEETHGASLQPSPPQSRRKAGRVSDPWIQARHPEKCDPGKTVVCRRPTRVFPQPGSAEGGTLRAPPSNGL